MDNIRKILKLDIISILPYFTLKNMLIMMGLSVFYFLISKNPVIIFSVPLLFSILYSSHPFLVGEEAGIDGLYRLFAIKTREVVIGRYILSFLLFIAGSLVGVVLLLISSFIFGAITMNGLIEYYLAYLFMYIILVSIQYPIYFKYGYTKAKTYAMLPFLVIGMISFFGVYLKHNLSEGAQEKIISTLFLLMSNKVLVIGLFFIILIGIIATSMFLSNKIYSKRDF